MELSVVIPAFNESAIIANTVNHVHEFLTRENIEGEIIAVNDGSTDETVKILAHLQESISNFRALTFPANTGKGAACRAGFMASRGEWCIFMDADESTKIETWNIFKSFTKNFDILIGSRATTGARVVKRQNILKVLAGKLGNKWIKLIAELPFNDTQCGFKAFHERTKKILEFTKINRWAFDIEWLAVARALGFKIKELPVEWRNDPTSLVRPVDYIRVLIDVFKIKFNIKKIPERA